MFDFTLEQLQRSIREQQVRDSYYYRNAVENADLSLAEKIFNDELEDDSTPDWNFMNEWSWKDNTFLDGIGHVSVEQDHGGGEGDGEERWVVIRVENSEGTRYFRIDGYYMSYDGSHFDGELREVSVVERLVKFYE